MKPNLKRRASSNGKGIYRYSILSETAGDPCSLNTWRSYVADGYFCWQLSQSFACNIGGERSQASCTAAKSKTQAGTG